MTNTGITGLVLIIANTAVSYKGFTSQQFFDTYKFEVDKILVNKDYQRLLTSGFLHVGWAHLIFNMISLYAFSGTIENELGNGQFLVIYFASLLGGSLFSLLIHKQHGDYSAVGASGAVSGVIFASIALFPGGGIGFFFLPFSIPGWLFGIVYVGFSLYGIKSKKDNIGHEAHLGGALAGMAVALCMQPYALAENYITILIIAVPAIVFTWLIIKKPGLLLIDNYFYKTHQDFYSVDHKYNAEKTRKQREIDAILDKISKTGMDSLSPKEKKRLKQYSK